MLLGFYRLYGTKNELNQRFKRLKAGWDLMVLSAQRGYIIPSRPKKKPVLQLKARKLKKYCTLG